MSFKQLNIIVGWVVMLIATATYFLTAEATVSFWDCGEYILSANELQIVHPPGAPTYALIGRIPAWIASMIDVQYVGLALNWLSGLGSAFTVLFTFWIMTYIGQRIWLRDERKGDRLSEILVLGSSAIGALAFCFSDSFWFSAVEGEVYGLSMFFAGLIWWCAVRWHKIHDQPGADRWLVLIALLLGISIGVHFLTMLVLPTVGLMVGITRYRKPKEKTFGEFYQNNKQGLHLFFGSIIGLWLLFTVFANSTAPLFNRLGGWILFSGVIVGGYWLCYLLLQKLNHSRGSVLFGLLIGGGMVAFSFLGLTDKFVEVVLMVEIGLVNGVGLPLGAGVIVTLLASGAIFFFTLRYSTKHGLVNFNTALLAALFSIIGLSTYAMVPIRAQANTPINMNNPRDIYAFHAYLTREQYGHRPLMVGPYYTAQPVSSEENGFQYAVKDGKYVKDGTRRSYNYKLSADQKRGLAQSNPQQLAALERSNKMTIFPRMGHTGKPDFPRAYEFWTGMSPGEAPGFGDNIKFFLNYQMGEMFGRYLLWNFAGRQNGKQSRWNNSEGSWISGFNSQNSKPKELQSGAYNRFFMLPFLLGLIGCVFLFMESKKWWAVVFMTFLFMGFMNLINSNEPPFEPRERDYALVGAFMAFAMWVGFGVMGIFKWIREYAPKMPATYGVLALGALAPILMASQGWNDHDRSERTIALASAKNYLNSCKQDAILFCYGDNDTYPLWYAQQVLGYRTDVRIVNMSLAGVDWYINSMRHSADAGKPVEGIIPYDNLTGEQNLLINITDRDGSTGKITKNGAKRYDLIKVLESLAAGKNSIPSKKFKLDIDKAAQIQNCGIPENWKDRIVEEIAFDMPGKNKSSFQKDKLLMFDIVAANINKRPIHFGIGSSRSGYQGFNKYFHRVGMTYQLIPVDVGMTREWNQRVVAEESYEIAMNADFGGIDDPEKDIYLNEVDMMNFNFMRDGLYYLLAQNYYNRGARDSTKRAESWERAANLIDKALTSLPKNNIDYYDFRTLNFASLYKQMGQDEKAYALVDDVMPEIEKSLEYYKAMEYDERRGHAIYCYNVAQSYERAIRILTNDEGRAEQLARYEASNKELPNAFPFLFQQGQ